MGILCVAAGCKSRQESSPHLSFYRFPADPQRRKRWVAAVKRDGWEPTQYSRLCSEHFISGAKSNHPLSPDFVPSVFRRALSPQKRKGDQQPKKRKSVTKRKRAVEGKANAVDALLELSTVGGFGEGQPEPLAVDDRFPEEDEDGVCCQTDLTMSDITAMELELHKLRTDYSSIRDKLKTSAILEEGSFEGNSEKVEFFTGLPSFAVLMALFNVVAPGLKDNVLLGSFQQFLLTCMRLRLNLTVEFLGHVFGATPSAVSRIFDDVIDHMNASLVPLLVLWPEREQLRKTLPVWFRGSALKNCVCVVDRFELSVEPAAFEAQEHAYSQISSLNTVKYLVGITPQGTVSYVSPGCAGRRSHADLTRSSEFLRNLLPGDLLLADRAFGDRDQEGLCCARVDIPFPKGKKELTPVELEGTKGLSAVQLHVERVIGVTRQKYAMLQSPLPAALFQPEAKTDLTTLDKVVRVTCAMANVCESVVPLE